MTNRPLAGKVALVTGSARRIGRETALALAEEGAHVITHARSSLDEIEAVAEEIRAAGGQATALLADITDEVAVAELVARIQEKAGPVDILVNNAAIRGEKPLAQLDLETFRSVYAVAVEGAFLVTRAVMPDMVSGASGVSSPSAVSAPTQASRTVCTSPLPRPRWWVLQKLWPPNLASMA